MNGQQSNASQSTPANNAGSKFRDGYRYRPDPQGQLFPAPPLPAIHSPNMASTPAAPDRSAAAEREHRTAAAGGGLFQYYGQCCDKKHENEFPTETGRVTRPEDLGEIIGNAYRVRPCRCRRWFCEYCGPRLGVTLRQRLTARLKSFQSVYGLTLTVDGSLFDSPQQAWSYVMDNRILSRLVRELDRNQFLLSKAYFWVVEFQKQTEQPHWHMLLETKHIPYGELVEIYSRFRPADAAPLAEPITAENYRGQAPAFGSIRFSAPKGAARAAYYATKYLTKHPEHGYPDWVLDRVGRMPRFGHSHRFFPRESKHDPMCFCDECRGQSDVPPQRKATPRKPGDPEKSTLKREAVTIRERLASCEQTCSLIQVRQVLLPDGTVIDGRARFNGKLSVPFREACEFVGESSDSCWQLELDGETATALEEYAKHRAETGESK